MMSINAGRCAQNWFLASPEIRVVTGQVANNKRSDMFIREGAQLRLAYRRTQISRNKLAVPMLSFSADGYGLELGLSLGPAKDKVPLQSPAAALTHTALLEADLTGSFAVPTGKVDASQSEDQRKAQQKRKEELRETQHRARHDAAFVALQSGDPELMSKGVTAAYSYMHRLGDDGATVADVPLFVALMAAPDSTQTGAPRALQRAAPKFLMPVVDAVLDHVIAVGDGPMDQQSRLRFKNILMLVRKMPGEHIASRVERLNQLSATRLGRQIGGKLIAESAILGTEQAPLLLAFLDGRIADQKPRDGFDVAFLGLCLMGSEGVRFLDDVLQRDREIGNGFYGPKLHTSIYSMVLLGLDDEAIRTGLRFDRFAKESKRKSAENSLRDTRARAEKALSRAKDRNIEPTPRHLCR